MPAKRAYVRGLVDRRARAAGDEQRLLGLLKELGKELALVRRTKASCDQLIRDYDAGLDPSRIKPIRKVRKVASGPRGGLRLEIIQAVKSRAPAAVTTMEVALVAAHRLDLDFETRDDLQRWEHNSVGKQLKRLVVEGLVAREVDTSARAWTAVRWRWTGPGDESASDPVAAEIAAAARTAK